MIEILKIIGALATSTIVAYAVFTCTMIALANSKIRFFTGGLESIAPLIFFSTIAAILSGGLVMWGML